MESLTTRLLWVPTLHSKNDQELAKSSIMVSTRERGGHNARGGHGSRGRPQCKYCERMGNIQENCFSLHNLPDKDNQYIQN